MIYKAFLNRQEITGFPVKGKETSEIWGGDTLLWRKKSKGIFKFEYFETIEFGVKGTGLNIDWGDGTSEYLADKHKNVNLYDKNAQAGYLTHSSGTKTYTATITGNITDMVFGRIVGANHYAGGLTRVLSPLPATSNFPYSQIGAFLFDECINLQSVPENFFSLVPSLTELAFTFYKVNISEYPETMFDYLQNLATITSTFSNSSIEKVSGKMFGKCSKLKQAKLLFSGCSKLTTVEEGFLSTQSLSDFINNFNGCKKLVTVGTDFLKNVDIDNSTRGFENEFYNCSNLRQAPNFYEKYPYLGKKKTDDCYYNCKSLGFYSSLPSTWK
jgi:hypothetical protein|nr:MAG TPA_asm: putative protein-rich repeat protein [Caudoviricetes sp.]DAV93818.1 MAG TPA: putative protein-rich repeat protein [Caudoviricetes sp.]